MLPFRSTVTLTHNLANIVAGDADMQILFICSFLMDALYGGGKAIDSTALRVINCDYVYFSSCCFAITLWYNVGADAPIKSTNEGCLLVSTIG